MLEKLALPRPRLMTAVEDQFDDWSGHALSEGENACEVVEPSESGGIRPRPSSVLSGSKLRRRERRYSAVADRLWIEWWDGGEYNGRCARLVNVSRNGAMILASALLRPMQNVRVFLEDAAPEIGVESRVLGVVEGKSGLNQIRLEFCSPCPDVFLEASANAFESWLARRSPRD
jgi:hypothetical protein